MELLLLVWQEPLVVSQCARQSRGITLQQLSTVLRRKGELRKIRRVRTRCGDGVVAGILLVGVFPMSDSHNSLAGCESQLANFPARNTYTPITNLQTHSYD